MKGSFEYSLIFLMGCFMLTVLFQTTQMLAQLHQGHLYLDYVVSMTEDYDGDIEKVNLHAKNSLMCKRCYFSHQEKDNRWVVTVNLPLNIPVINFEEELIIRGITSRIE